MTERTGDDVANETHELERAHFVARENRFVCRIRRVDAEVVRAHLPNTARLPDLLVPEAPVIVRASRDPRRRTAWTLTRVRHEGTWVALEAGVASRLVADHLDAGGDMAGFPAPARVRREVRSGAHRLDLGLDLADGRQALVEVKSLSRSVGGRAPLSWTPSVRGADHLAHLAALAEQGTTTAVVFVVQRGDVRALDLSLPADPGWLAAVREARGAGVRIRAFRCEVTPRTLRLAADIPVLDGPEPEQVAGSYAATHIELETPGRPPVVLVPVPGGSGPGTLPDLVPPGTRRLHIITACNPRSQLLDTASNAERNARLLAEVRAGGLRVVRADGGAPDGSWHEPGFALVDTEVEVALGLARRYDQHAIFELTGEHLTVRWTDPRQPPIVQGWRPGP